jgi:hypothetical protein
LFTQNQETEPMFEYLEPDATGAGAESSACPWGQTPEGLAKSGCATCSTAASPGIDRTIKILHALGYADPNDWSEPIPVPPSSATATAQPNQWMVIITKTLLLE